MIYSSTVKMKEALIEIGSSKNLVRFESGWVASDKTLIKQKVCELVQKNQYLQTLIKPDTFYLVQIFRDEYDCYVDVTDSDQIPHKAKLKVVIPDVTDSEATSSTPSVQQQNGAQTGVKRGYVEEEPEVEEEYDEGIQYVPEEQVEEMVKQGYVIAPGYEEEAAAYPPPMGPPHPHGSMGPPRGPMFRGPPRFDQGFGPPPMQRFRMDFPGGFHPYHYPAAPHQNWLQLMEFEAEDLDLTRKETPQIRKIFEAAYNIADRQPVQLLNEYCQRRNWEKPKFELVIDGTTRKEPIYKFQVDIKGHTIEADRHSKSKKQAKVYAALKALYIYRALF